MGINGLFVLRSDIGSGGVEFYTRHRFLCFRTSLAERRTVAVPWGLGRKLFVGLLLIYLLLFFPDPRVFPRSSERGKRGNELD